MIRKTLLICVLLSFIGLFSGSVAQAQSASDLDRISEVIQQAVQQRMPGWKHKRGQPITGSDNVLVESYSSKDGNIKLSVLPYVSNEEASNKIRHFFSTERVQSLTDLGDEGCAWGYGNSKFAFRINKLNVFVSIDAEDMSGKEVIARQFANTVAEALKDF